MTTALGVWRYLLRNGQFINAQIQLAQKHLFRYVTKDGSVIFALLSSAAERLLYQLSEFSTVSVRFRTGRFGAFRKYGS